MWSTLILGYVTPPVPTTLTRNVVNLNTAGCDTTSTHNTHLECGKLFYLHTTPLHNPEVLSDFLEISDEVVLLLLSGVVQPLDDLYNPLQRAENALSARDNIAGVPSVGELGQLFLCS